MRRNFLSCGLLVLAGLLVAAARADDALAEESTRVRAAIAGSLPLLRLGAEGHVRQRTCFACHNQALPMLALTTARERGFAVDGDYLTHQLEFIARFLDKNRELYREGTGQGGQADTASYALFTLELGGWQPDAATDAVVEYLLLRDQDRDHWRTTSNRPPSEASDFTVTTFALRALRYWGAPEQQDRISRRIDKVLAWLLRTPAVDTEDHVFRMWGLQLAAADEADRQEAVKQLLAIQRADGGWGQTPEMTSDAYATGSALVALHQAGGLATTSSAYQRGVRFLLNKQLADGSWHVASRSKPFQTYFESGFPHGKDQFISIAASGWATTALALACSPSRPTTLRLPSKAGHHVSAP